MTEAMTPELITIIVAGILAIFAGPGIYGYLARRKDQPIKETEVDITVATSINKVALDTLAAVGGISKELKEELAQQKREAKARADEQDARLKTVESKLREVQELNDQKDRRISGWRSWFAGLERDWQILRQRKEVPPPPYGETT